MNSEKVIIFDVGRVLINFSFDPFEKFLIENGAKISTRNEFYEATDLFKYESGEITTQDFISAVKNLLTTPVDTETIIKEWQSIFSPIDEMIEFCKSCSLITSTYILSNTNQLHWEHLDKNYNLGALTKKAYTSFELGVMKPHEKIYKLVENEITINPANYLFIDDLAENIKAAKTLGWGTVLHEKISDTKNIVLNFIES